MIIATDFDTAPDSVLLSLLLAAESIFDLGSPAPRDLPRRQHPLRAGSSKALFENFTRGIKAATNREDLFMTSYIPYAPEEDHFVFFVKFLCRLMFTPDAPCGRDCEQNVEWGAYPMTSYVFNTDPRHIAETIMRNQRETFAVVCAALKSREPYCCTLTGWEFNCAPDVVATCRQIFCYDPATRTGCIVQMNDYAARAPVR